MLIDASPVLEISEMAYVASVGISMSVSHLDVTKKNPFAKLDCLEIVQHLESFINPDL